MSETANRIRQLLAHLEYLDREHPEGCPDCAAIRSILHDRALIAKDNEPGDETGLGKTNALGAAAFSQGPSRSATAQPVSKNLTPADSPGPTMTDDEAFEELVGSRFQLEAFMGSVDKGSRAALAHLRSRLAPKKVSREWVDEFSQKVTWGPFAGWAIQMLEELGVEVEDPFAPLTEREEQGLEDDERERRHDASLERVEDK